MIKAIIFDFDGVILESADIKTDAFADLFSDYPQLVEKILAYHIENAGISRYVKFRYFYETLLGKELSKEQELALGERFSEIVLQKVLQSSFVVGAKEFLDARVNDFMFFIASGTPQKELQIIVKKRNLQGYFKEIYGTPRKKLDIIVGIIDNYKLDRREVVYIGDAPSDRIAAVAAEVTYVERRKDMDHDILREELVIKDLSSFGTILEEINNKIRGG